MKIQKTEFKTILANFSKIVKPNGVLPIAGSVLFKGGNLSGTNMSAFVTVRGAYEPSIGDKPFVVDLGELRAAVNSATTDEIEIVTGEGVITLRFGRSKIQIPAQTADEFLLSPEKDKARPYSVPGDVFAAAMRTLPGFAIEDDLRPQLTGIYFDGREFVATDTRRLAVLAAGGEVTDPVTIPKAVAAFALTGECAQPVTIGRNFIQWGLTEVVFQPLEGRYVDYRSVFPNPEDLSIVEVYRDELLDAIRVANVSASKGSRIGKITLRKDVAIVESEDVDFNKSSTTEVRLLSNLLPEEIVIGVNLEYLASIVELCDTEAKIRVVSPSRPAVIDVVGGQCLLMPVALLNSNA